MLHSISLQQKYINNSMTIFAMYKIYFLYKFEFLLKYVYPYDITAMIILHFFFSVTAWYSRYLR